MDETRDDRPEPGTSDGEMDMLTGFLDYHRATVFKKVDGLGDADLRKQLVPSGTTLLGLVKHLAYVEHWWFHMVFAGQPGSLPWDESEPNAQFFITPDDSTDYVLDLYRAECDRAREHVSGATPDDICRARFPEGQWLDASKFNLRWVLTHMIEETARHNGHLDILRELIDGTTGE